MDPKITIDRNVTTLVNTLTVEPSNQQALLELLRENTKTVISTLDGWISTSFLVAKDLSRVVIYSQWRDLAAIQAMQASPDMRACFPRIAALATIDSLVADVAFTHHS